MGIIILITHVNEQNVCSSAEAAVRQIHPLGLILLIADIQRRKSPAHWSSPL
jgi:hypothetical protein